MKVSIIGNAARNIGIATAADLALAGHEVSLCVPENASEQFSTVMDGKGVLVQGDVKQLSAGTTGFANFAYAGHDEKTALEDAAVVILDLPLPELSTRFANLVDHLPREAVVHVQSYGCWAAAMLGRVAIVAGRNDILVTEAKAPTIAARFDGSVVTAGVLRRKLEISTTRISQIGDALARLNALFPDFIAASSVLQTSMENVNLMVHPAMSLLGCAMFERAELANETIQFYRDANSPGAGLLADALDAERAGVCRAYGVRHQGLPETLSATYGATGEDSYTTVASCSAYQSLPPMKPDIWREWILDDVPFGVSPLVLLGDQPGFLSICIAQLRRYSGCCWVLIPGQVLPWNSSD